MSLVISRNGHIRDYSLPSELPLRRVIKSHNKDNEFEEQLVELSPEEREKEGLKQRYKQANLSYQKSESNQSQTTRHIWLAKEVMTKPVHTLDESATAITALQLMNKFNFHHVPVTRDGQLVGMISDRDLLPYSQSELSQMNLKQLGSKEVIGARDSTDLRTISAIMLKEFISALPILDKNSALIGIITKSDILRLVMKQGPFEIHV